MASIVGYYKADPDLTTAESITDYSAAGLDALASAEAGGAILRAVYDDGTERQVTAAQVTNPNVGGTGSASVGVTYSSAGSQSSSGSQEGVLTAQSVGWDGEVTVGGVTLEFAGGLLINVT